MCVTVRARVFSCKGYEGVRIVVPSTRAFYLLCEHWPSCTHDGVHVCALYFVRWWCVQWSVICISLIPTSTRRTPSHTQPLIFYSLIRARRATLYTCTCKLVTQPAPLAHLEKVCNVPLVWLLTTCHTWWVETVKWGRAKLWEVFFYVLI